MYAPRHLHFCPAHAFDLILSVIDCTISKLAIGKENTHSDGTCFNADRRRRRIVHIYGKTRYMYVYAFQRLTARHAAAQLHKQNRSKNNK